jgi:hypothetical protein
MNSYDLLVKSIDVANNLLEDFIIHKGLKDNLTEVLSSLFRKMIELSDGVRVSAENGLKGPAELNYRGLLEAYLGFRYIIEDPKLSVARAAAYKIGYHKHQIEATQYAIDNDFVGNAKAVYEKALLFHTNSLNKTEFYSLLEEFDRLQNANPRKHLPKWYSLYGGPKSVNKLAKIFEEDGRDLLQNMYGFLSTGAHNYLALRDLVLDENGKVSLKKTRFNFDPDLDQCNLLHTRTMLTSTMVRFISTLYPEYTNNLLPLFNEIKKLYS